MPVSLLNNTSFSGTNKLLIKLDFFSFSILLLRKITQLQTVQPYMHYLQQYNEHYLHIIM